MRLAVRPVDPARLRHLDQTIDVRRVAFAVSVLGLVGGAGIVNGLHPAAGPGGGSHSVEVTYTSRAALERVLRAHPAKVVRFIAPLHVAELGPSEATAPFIRAVRRLPGILQVRRTSGRTDARLADPTGTSASPALTPEEWQYYAAGVAGVPARVRAAAADVTIAVVDTGADVTSPALAGKVQGTYDVRTGRRQVADRAGHGTLVASLAGGVDSPAGGVAGFGGAARLLIVKVSDSATFNDVDVAAGIVYAVRHGARVINLSVAGREPSLVEKAALQFAARRGVLVVAAAGNDGLKGDPPEYPAALLQPIGSNGVGGLGLSVGASDASGIRAGFSEYGSFVSLLAPGQDVVGAVRSADEYASGTSFAAPEVAGAAALVWAANPGLSAGRVAAILKATASGNGTWSPELAFGVIDAAKAVRHALAASAGRENPPT